MCSHLLIPLPVSCGNIPDNCFHGLPYLFGNNESLFIKKEQPVGVLIGCEKKVTRILKFYHHRGLYLSQNLIAERQRYVHDAVFCSIWCHHVAFLTVSCHT